MEEKLMAEKKQNASFCTRKSVISGSIANFAAHYRTPSLLNRFTTGLIDALSEAYYRNCLCKKAVPVKRFDDEEMLENRMYEATSNKKRYMGGRCTGNYYSGNTNRY